MNKHVICFLCGIELDPDLDNLYSNIYWNKFQELLTDNKYTLTVIKILIIQVYPILIQLQ
jgi:hypothetical protein